MKPFHRTIVVFALAVLPFGAWGQSSDADFFGDDAPAVATAPVSSVDPTKAFTESAEGVRWGGTITSSATYGTGWVGQYPGSDLSQGLKDSLAYTLSTKLFVDGRPDKDFRFRLSLKTGYPFTTDTKVLTGAAAVASSVATTSTTLSVPNISVWEMFTDVTVNDALFLRFGKQSASWGVSYFYSPGDVISLTAKDATDPTAEREGPFALKATVPFPGLKANLTGFVLARDTYFGGDVPTLKTLGYALQADALVGEAQVSLGGFYQQANAPKVVATVNTGLGFINLPVFPDLNVFSEAVFSYGSDVRKGVGAQVVGASSYTVGTLQYASVTNWDKLWYYTGTVGASYSNSDANATLRVEYLFNPFGSNEKNAAERAYNSVIAGQMSSGEVLTPGMHNLTALLSLTKVAGSDKLSYSTLWQQNLSDGSGWVKPLFTLQPWDNLGFTWGLSLVYGAEGTQYPLLFESYDKNYKPLGTKTVTINVGVTFGAGKY
jgi:hypothetical protein